MHLVNSLHITRLVFVVIATVILILPLQYARADYTIYMVKT